MSRITAQDKSYQDHEQAAEHGHDVDAEHRPEVARRASVANLQKQAAKSGSAEGATVEEKKAQREKSNQSLIKGAEATIKFASQQMFMHADKLEAFAAAPKNEAGTEPLRNEIVSANNATFDHVDAVERALTDFLGAGVVVAPLQPAIAVMQRAYTRFDNVVSRVSRQVQRSEDKVPFGEHSRVEASVNRTLGAVGLNHQSASHMLTSGDLKEARETSEDKARASAFHASLIAAEDAIRLARMSVRGIADDVRIHDLKRAFGLIQELAMMAHQLPPQMLKAHRGKLQHVSSSVNQMFAEQHAHPAFDRNLNASLTSILDASSTIQATAAGLANPAQKKDADA